MARVLIADDEQEFCFVAERALIAAGHTVRIARDGNEALACLREAAVDVAVVDIYMPVKDGIETIVDIHQRHPGIKIIAITGSMSQVGLPMLNVAKKLGAHLALAKPFTVEELIAAVQTVLGVQPTPAAPAA
jgi:CheY-like chemotaxis protein